MKFIIAFFIPLFIAFNGYSQCVPDPNVIALGDPENDGVLNPHFMEVYAGQEVDLSVTVLSPPGGEGEIGGFLSVPYTMNYFIVKRLDNMPSWVSYECPNDCRFDVNDYSCVHVIGTAPSQVPVGDSTVMNVIVDATVDASWSIFSWNDYTVEDEDGGTLSIRYIETPSSIQRILLVDDILYDNSLINVKTGLNVNNINIYNIHGALIASSTSGNQISISNQPKGIYVVEVNTDEFSVIKKIVKY